MKKNYTGQSLFEVVVAIGIVSAILVGIMSLAAHSLSNATFSRDQAMAQTYNQEALEWLRGERDKDWAAFAGYSSYSGADWCLQTLGWDNSGFCSSTETIPGTNFRRQVQLSSVSTDEIMVTVSTYWEGRGGLHKAQTYTKLNNWQTK